jgi:hypothetical protein
MSAALSSHQQHATKKKKVGRKPAHENTFAFHHNAKSKTTAKILAAPIEFVCQRDFDKLTWRKQYRKYKPRTVLGKCNLCDQKTIRHAYHTICEPCTRVSKKATLLLQEWNNETASSNSSSFARICAVCCCQPALPDANGADQHQTDQPGHKLKLRELKTLERLRDKSTKKATANQEDDDCDQEEDEDEEDDAENPEATDEGMDFDDNDEEDPFLKAVGGADKLLTGPAYQKHLLEQQQKLQERNVS